METSRWLLAFWALILPFNTPQATTHCASPSPSTIEAIVRVSSADAIASGIVIATNRVLTAAHTLSDSRDITVEIHGKKRAAYLIIKDEENDIALLSVPTEDIQPIPLSQKTLKKHDTVWTIGYPFGKQLDAKAGTFKQNWNDLLFTSAPVTFGQSGGGLIQCENNRHTLAGMIRAFVMLRKNNQQVAEKANLSASVNIANIQALILQSQQIALADF